MCAVVKSLYETLKEMNDKDYIEKFLVYNLSIVIKESGMSVRAFAERCGLPESTVYTILKKGAGKANVNNVISMCKVLGITVEELDEISKGEKVDCEPTYEDIQSLIARNGKKLTLEQKQDIIRTLLSDD